MRKFWIAYFFTLIIFAVLASMTVWVFYPLFSKENGKFVSPLPSFLTRSNNAQVSTLDIWEPIRNFFGSAQSGLNVTGTSFLSYDLTENKPILEKNPNQKVPLASLTKIMTAIVALEHPKQNNSYVVSNSDLVGEDSMGLSVGEVLSLHELLLGLILHSGNDAAETLASNFLGGREAFIEAMNQKAGSLGLTNTHFTNPTGLEGDGDQHTTAYDLLVITRYALESFQEFRDVAATIDTTIPQTETHKEYFLENETNLLTSYPGVKGVKTGYTPEAGLCLVTYLEYQDHKIIAILLGSNNRRQEMKDILDYSLKKEGITPPQHG